MSFAGLIVQARARETGTLTTVYDTEAAMLDPDSGRYSVVCEDHGTIFATDSLSMARWLRAHPLQFCDDCRGDDDA